MSLDLENINEEDLDKMMSSEVVEPNYNISKGWDGNKFKSSREKFKASWKPTEKPIYKEIQKVEPLNFEGFKDELFEFMKAKLIKEGTDPRIKFIDENKKNANLVTRIFFESNESLFLYGDNSGGKTFLMDNLCELRNSLFWKGHKIKRCYKINFKDAYKRSLKEKSISFLDDALNKCITTKSDMYVDDLGYGGQSSQNLYGTQIELVSVFADMFEHLTLNGLNYYINSNMDPNYILEVYKKGVHDRIFRAKKILWIRKESLR